MRAISDEEFESRFDAGEDVLDYVDVSQATRPNLDRAGDVVTLDMPAGMLRGIDRAAARIGIDRQSVIKVWIAERLEQETGIDPRMAGAGA